MDHDLDGEIVVVTGGSSGIGESAVKLCKEKGAKVAIFDIEEPKVTHDLYVKVDISKEEEVSKAFELVSSKLGRVTGLVNNAGISPKPTDTADIESSEIIRTFSINVFGALYCTKYAIRQMMESGHGSIVNVSSIIGLVGAMNSAIYAASKSALLGMTKADAVTYASKNIRVNAVLPGYARTPLIQKAAMNSGNPEKYIQNLEGKHAMGRIADPDEIAQAIVFLLSRKSSFVTGSELVVDGGYTSV